MKKTFALLFMAALLLPTQAQTAATHPWKGKRVAYFGDSITDPRNNGSKRKYWNFLQDWLQITPYVYGISGRQWNDIPRQADKLKQEHGDNFDAILIFIGTNDFNAAVPIGQWYAERDDSVLAAVHREKQVVVRRRREPAFDSGTYRGRINTAMQKLKAMFPTKQVVLMTPLHRGYFYGGEQNIQPKECYQNECGEWVDAYVESVKQAGNIWAVPVIDLNADSGLFPLVPEQIVNFKGETDQLHPNDRGHERMARVIERALAGIPCTFESTAADTGEGDWERWSEATVGSTAFAAPKSPAASKKKKRQAAELWPDGTPIDQWFADTAKVDVGTLGKRYVITDYGVAADSTLLQTERIQHVIDRCAQEGGGVVVIPRGTFLSGALFFRPGTHLHVSGGAVLKGIDAIKHYPLVKTRMEGQTLNYFAALVNADGIDGFTITGRGTINGNGLRFWEEFWIRRKFNRQCTNLEALRPRLVYISNCKNVTVQDVHLINSAFWTNHLYRCKKVRYLGCTIYAPHTPEESKAPSSDALDIDVCQDVLVDRCRISVNDDAVVLKGGKGTWADQNPDNGPSYRIIVQNCHYGLVHGCVTLGSESLHDWNVVLRNCHIEEASNVLWLKMRPDTPQHYEYVTVENLTGNCKNFLLIRPWTQFYKPEQRDDMPLSQCNNITIRNIRMRCKDFFAVSTSEKYALKNFAFEHINVEDEKDGFNPALIENATVNDVVINGKQR